MQLSNSASFFCIVSVDTNVSMGILGGGEFRAFLSKPEDVKNNTCVRGQEKKSAKKDKWMNQ